MWSSSPHTQHKFDRDMFVGRSLFTKPPGPSSTGGLASRYFITRRYSSCNGHAIKESCIIHSGEEDEQETSDSESSPSQGSTANTSIASLDTQKLERPPPRVVFLELPVEILEHITASTRDSVPVLEAASRYIDERYSEFSQARFTLSAFSKVCSTLRKTVERILYRDVQVDFTGWKGRKHTKWPAGSLRLLLRTLEERPELGRYVHTAALDYHLSSKSGELEKGLETFLGLTPNLKTLFLGQCPLALWDFPLLRITTFATTYAHGILPSILEHFPKLETLHLRDCHVMNFSSSAIPPHRLRKVRLDSSHDHAAAHFLRALNLCADSVHHLDLRFLGGLLQPSPVFTPKAPALKVPSAASNLRSLRLDNISIFTHTNSGYAQLLQSLPALQDLHVTNHSCFSPDAFSILPPSLCTLTVSEYYGYWESMRDVLPDSEPKNEAFLTALSMCITASWRKVSSVVGSAGKQNCASDLVVISSACALEDQDIFKQVDEDDAFVRITFTKS